MIDTSSWIALFGDGQGAPREGALTVMDALIAQGGAVSPLIAYDELPPRRDRLLSWIGARRRAFVEHDRDMVATVFEINTRFPRLVNYGKSIHGADPYVIALAVQMRNRGLPGPGPGPVAVVTKESDSPNSPTGIPYAARKCGISRIRMAELFDREGPGARSPG